MKRSLFWAALLLAASLTASAKEGRLLRFPATNGQDVVFTYAGDLYKAPLTGGCAERLTSHIGYEMFARFSPDGKTIAFTGQYDGNTEVYTIPVSGGSPCRLTFTATNERDDLGDRMGPNNIVMCWTVDGKDIIYRNRISDGFDGMLWSVPAKGGMSDKLPLPEGAWCSYSPDGKKLAYNRTCREFRTWKYYRGGQADDIWIYDGKKVTNITDNPAQDIMPMWIGDEIFFISDRDHWMNVFVYDCKTSKVSKVTDFKEYDVKFPSSDGKHIVFENAGYIYSLDPATKKYSKVNIELNPEAVYARSEKKDVSGDITSFSLNDKGDRLALTARGEVYTVPVKPGITRNLTRTPGANDRAAEYSPDGKYVVYISDATGETELYAYDVEKATAVQLTKDNDTYIRGIEWAPDSRSVVYSDRKNRLVHVTVPEGMKTIIGTCPEAEYRSYSFSPDSKWLTYTKPGKNEMGVVYIYNFDTKKETAVTDRWYDSSSPVFSADGKYLIFCSQRDYNPVYSQVEWDYAYTNMGSLYLAVLDKDGKSPFLPEDGEAVEEKQDKEEGKPVVKFDAEGIAGRIVKLPVGAGYFRPIYSDGKGVWFNSRGGASYFDFKSSDVSKVTEGSMGVYGKKAVIYSAGKIYVTDLPKKKFAADKAVDLSHMVADIDYGKEWAQIFDEAWRAFRDGFYLENMHGIDWKAMRAKYEVLLPYVSNRVDLNYVIGEMIAELTVGHSYVSLGEYPQPERIPMGLLGAEIVPAKGVFQIKRIIKGEPYREALRSPLTEAGMDIREGDYIVAVDGVPTSEVSNFYELMVGKADVLTELSVSSKPSADGARKVIVKPIENEYPLIHNEWVQKNIDYVDKVSKGRIGYIYIPDMGVEGLNEFVRLYYPQLDKEALIVDDRANGGGNVSPMILERLMRDPYSMTMYRNSSLTGKVPDGSFVGPKVCLINRFSASDGDLFPWRFKKVGLGELIGKRTWGGIVGITSSLPYMDGTQINVPFFTNYDRETGEWIIENHGVDPDIEIDNDPIKENSGIDQQLDKAIEVLLKKLVDSKPLPGVPAPRDFSYPAK